MPEIQKENSNTEMQRPNPTAEQMRAFKDAYTMLTRISTGEHGKELELKFDPNSKRVEDEPVSKGPQFKPNSVGATAIVDFEGTEQYAWTRSYGEDLSHESGMLGSFSFTTDDSGVNQHVYEFYSDGNIEKLLWEVGGTEDSDFGPDDRWTPISWLNTEDIEQLAQLIESSHFAFNHPATS